MQADGGKRDVPERQALYPVTTVGGRPLVSAMWDRCRGSTATSRVHAYACAVMHCKLVMQLFCGLSFLYLTSDRDFVKFYHGWDGL